MFLGILYFSGVLAILTQLIIAQYISLKGSFDDGYSGVFVYGNCFPFLNHKLNSTPFESRAVVATEDCIEACTVSHRCRSINLKAVPEKDKKFICQLLESDKFNSTDLFAASLDFHHYSFVAPCYHNPCKNGGKCRPVIEKYDFNCQCTEHFGGKKCDLPRISQGSNVCTWFLENGSNKSGIYQVAADGTDIISIFCDQTNQGGGWTMVFKLVAGVSADISRLWSSGDPLNENNAEVLNTTSTPKEHYKNRMIRNWNTLGLKEVRVVLYKNDSEALFISFNATGTDNINWFAKNRVTESPWTDLGSESQNIFSNIDPHAHSGRSFHINKNYGGCPVDAGWLLVTEGKPCEYEEKLPPIVILYSKLHNYTNWNFQENVGTADVLVVFVR